MNNMDLLKIMNDLDDDMLLNAENKNVSSCRRQLIRIAAVAAVVLLLTACSVASYKVAISMEPDTVCRELSGEARRDREGNVITGTKITINFDTKPQALDEKLQKKLMKEGNLIPSGPYCFDESKAFRSIEDFEAALGIRFDLSKEAREGANRCIPYYLNNMMNFQTALVDNPDGDCRIAPVYIELQIPLRVAEVEKPENQSTYIDIPYEEYGNTVYLYVHIPYTEEAAEKYNAYDAFCRKGQSITEKSMICDGRELSLLCWKYDGAKNNRNATAMYTSGGIGYMIGASNHDGTEDALELLKPYLKNWD